MKLKTKLGGIVAAAAVVGGGLVAGPLTSAGAGDVKTEPSVGAPLSAAFGAWVNVAPGGHGFASVTCPAGKIVSGGGGQTSAFDIEFTDSYPSGNGWVIRGTNHGGSTQQLRADAVCLGLV
jgi:hypothetical protein